MRVPAHPTLIRRLLDARLKKLATARPALAASLVTIAKHCGRPGGHCLTGGPKHPGHYLTCKMDGKTRTTYVPHDLRADVRSWIDNHRRLQQLLHEIPLLTLALVRTQAQHQKRRQGRPGTAAPSSSRPCVTSCPTCRSGGTPSSIRASGPASFTTSASCCGGG